jgi:hypothetical protein
VSGASEQQTTSLFNSAPQHHYVAQAAIEQLRRWAGNGTPPPAAPRLPLTEAADDGVV